jgi:hypothetical protein
VVSDRPTIIGKTGNTQGESTVKTPAKIATTPDNVDVAMGILLFRRKLIRGQSVRLLLVQGMDSRKNEAVTRFGTKRESP